MVALSEPVSTVDIYVSSDWSFLMFRLSWSRLQKCH